MDRNIPRVFSCAPAPKQVGNFRRDGYTLGTLPTMVASLGAWVPGATTVLSLSFYGPALPSYRSRAITD